MNANVFSNASIFINSGSTSNAVQVNNCLEEITKQLAGNRQHIDLFYSMYIKLLDRLFGEDVTRPPNTQADPNWAKGVPGGWLRALMTVSTAIATPEPGSHRQVQSGRGTNANYIDSLPHPTRSLLHKLAPLSTVFDLIAKFQGGFEIDLALLPAKLQMFIIGHSVYAAVQSGADSRICLDLLRNPINTPNQRNNIVNKKALLLDGVEYILICLLRYPTLSHTALAPSSTYSAVRFNPLEALHNRGPAAWIRGLPYLALLNEYLKLYLPYAAVATAGVDGAAAGGALGGTPRAAPADQSAQVTRYGELFVRLAVAYWVDCALVLHFDHGKLGQYRRQMSHNNNANNGADAEGGAAGNERPHPSPMESLLVDVSSLRWTVASVQCAYLLVMRILADPQLREHISLLGERPDLQSYGGLNRRTPALNARYGLFGGAHGAAEGPQCNWQALQLPLYDMLRVIFNHGESAALDSQVLVLATELWLLYLQPWTARPICNGTTGVLPTRSNNLGAYSSEWRPYVAANLHFYTTLLACYMRLVSKRPLSVSEHEGAQHLATLERVLGVFTPALAAVVDDLTRAFKKHYVPAKHFPSPSKGPSHAHFSARQGLRTSGSNSSLNSSSNVFQTPGFVSARVPMTKGYDPSTPHEADGDGPGDDVPSAGPEILALVRFQHERLYPDRRIDELADCGIADLKVYAAAASIDVVATLHQINESLNAVHDSQLFAIVYAWLNFPPQTGAHNVHSERLQRCIDSIVRLVPSAKAGISNSNGGHDGNGSGDGGNGKDGTSSAVQRDPSSGRLTDQGRRRILQGQAKCSVEELLQPRALSRDPMDCPVCSFELGWLVRATVRLSRALNETFALPATKEYMMCSWETILRRALLARPHNNYFYDYIAHPLNVAHSCARFNLRFLASYRVLAAYLSVLLFVLYRFSAVSLLFLMVGWSTLAFVAYQNNFSFFR